MDEPLRASPAVDVGPAGGRTVRLVGVGERERAAAEREVARANRLASGMRPDDARWVLALKVSRLLEGGKAAILTPERRRHLLGESRRLGFRDFDANLLIAIVQDGRRSGSGALNLAVEQRLAMLHEPETPERAVWWPWAVAAVTMAGLIVLGLQQWVAGAPHP